MKIETKEIYKCDHCNKLYQIKIFCATHEIQCSKNPNNNRACFGCEYLSKMGAKVYSGIDNYHTSEPLYENRMLLYCVKNKTFLFPPKSEHKGNQYTDFHNEDNENNPMPRECDKFKEKEYL